MQIAFLLKLKAEAAQFQYKQEELSFGDMNIALKPKSDTKSDSKSDSNLKTSRPLTQGRPITGVQRTAISRLSTGRSMRPGTASLLSFINNGKMADIDIALIKPYAKDNSIAKVLLKTSTNYRLSFLTCTM
jgi:hypothetical protein